MMNTVMRKETKRKKMKVTGILLWKQKAQRMMTLRLKRYSGLARFFFFFCSLFFFACGFGHLKVIYELSTDWSLPY